MATQKVRPDPGALEPQHRDQRQRSTRRKAAVYGLVAAFVLIAAVIVISALPGDDRNTTPAGEPTASSSPWVLSTVGVYAVAIETGEPTLLFESPEGATEYSVAPGRDLVAFQSDDDAGDPQIFVMNADGTRLHQLTHEQAARSPAWSPDGTLIAYRGLAPDSSYEIYLVDVASGETNRITQERLDLDSQYTARPSWSQDGQTIVFQAGDHPVLRSVDIATGVTSTIVEDAGVGDVSPDGSRVAFNTWSTVEVTLANIDGSDRTILHDASGGSECCARWSPNGERIAFQSYPAGNVYVYELSTEELRIVGSVASSFDFVDWVDGQTLFISSV